MQLNSPTTGLYSCVVLLLAQSSTLVAVDTLAVEDSLVVGEGNLEEGSLAVVDIPEKDNLVVVHIPVVGEGNLEEGSLAVVDIPAVESNFEEDNLAAVYILEKDNLVVAHTTAVDCLEVAFAALLCRIVVARVDQD